LLPGILIQIEKARITKVVLHFKLCHPIFSFNFFELGKVAFGQNRFKPDLNFPIFNFLSGAHISNLCSLSSPARAA
jgi:hypothetical protein